MLSRVTRYSELAGKGHRGRKHVVTGHVCPTVISVERWDGEPPFVAHASRRNRQEMQQGEHCKHAGYGNGDPDEIPLKHPDIHENLGRETQHRYD